MAKQAIVPPDGKVIGEVLDLFKNESDRGVALIGSALVDDSLTHFIRSKLVNDESAVDQLLVGDVPLGTFSAKIKFAYCIGLIGADLRTDLNHIRSVRNDFAHNRSGISFSTNSILSHCKSFHSIELHNSFTALRAGTPRDCYIFACTFISGYFISFAESERQKIGNDNGFAYYVKHVTEKADLAFASRLMDKLESQHSPVPDF